MNANQWKWFVGALLFWVVAGCVAVQPGDAPGDVPAESANPSATLAATEFMTGTVTITSTVPLTTPQPMTGTATITATVPITDQVPLTGTATVTATMIVTASVTPSVTPPVTGTVEPTPIPTGGTPEPPETATATPPPTTAPTATPMPSPTPTEGVPPTPTSLPEGVFIGSDRSFTEGSDLYVVGEVVNGAGQPVYNVTIIATFVDPGGQIVGAQQDVTLLPKTDPALRNPFKLRLPNAPATINEYQLNLTWDDISIAEFDRVTIVSEDVQTDGGVVISGELRNDHRGEVRNVVVAATFYDASGNVINVYRGQVDAATLAPGATTTYTVQTSSSLIDYDHFLIQTQGLLVR